MHVSPRVYQVASCWSDHNVCARGSFPTPSLLFKKHQLTVTQINPKRDSDITANITLSREAETPVNVECGTVWQAKHSRNFPN